MSMAGIGRLTGFLYLAIIVCAGFAEGYVRSTLIVPGDAAATAANLIASESLWRLGFALDLVAFLCDAAVAVLLYVLLAPTNRMLALLAAAFRLVAHPAIAGINLINHLAPLDLVTGGSLTAFSPEQLSAWAMTFLELHGTGYLIAGAFFGVHLVLLGFLLFRSDLFPAVLGVLVVLAGMGYVIESFGMFLMPAYESVFELVVAVPAVLGEVSLAVWLVLRGVSSGSGGGQKG